MSWIIDSIGIVYGLFWRIGQAFSYTASQWLVIKDLTACTLPSCDILQTDWLMKHVNPYFDLSQSLGGSLDNYVSLMKNDVNIVYIIYRIMTAPLTFLGSIGTLLSNVLEHIGLGLIELPDLSALPMWIGIMIGSFAWLGIIFVVKWLAHLFVRS